MSRRTKAMGLITGLLASLSYATPTPLAAQQIAGEYQVEVRGTTHYLDRTPATRQLRDNTVLVVKQQDDRITLEFRSFASAMSTTVFEGRAGNDQFVALWTGSAGEARLITGTVDGNRLRGRLIYPRPTPDDAVPGWTEVEFSAVRQGRSSQGSANVGGQPVRQPTPLDRLPAGQRPVRPAPAVASADDADFAVDMTATTVPDAPIAGHRIEFIARATPTRRGESVERTELWINGLVQGSSDGSLLEVEAGPLEAGRLDYDDAAVAGDGRRSNLIRRNVDVAAAGNATISGRLSGALAKISDVQLVRPDGQSVAKSEVDGNGRYRFGGIPAGDYVIFVNDAKTEAHVNPTSNLAISIDGRSAYTRDFQVR